MAKERVLTTLKLPRVATTRKAADATGAAAWKRNLTTRSLFLGSQASSVRSSAVRAGGASTESWIVSSSSSWARIST